MKPVGRPPKRDINNDVISRTTINISVPVRLVEYLKREEIPRSELFVTVVSQYEQHKICSVCFSVDIHESEIGMSCRPCSRYAPTWYHLKRCTICQKQYKPGVNVPSAIKGSDDWGCQQCQE